MKKKITAFIVIIASLLTLLALHQPNPSSPEFEQWKNTFGLQYSSHYQNLYRQQIFKQNLASIQNHNQDPHRTYDMGVNQFTALTTQEFVSQYLGTRAIEGIKEVVGDSGVKVGDIDWEEKGAVTRVKSQGNCGACWAFSTVGGLEGLYQITAGTLQNFSQQQLIDCASSKYGNQGCNGGLMDGGYKYVIQHGVVREQDYPYKATQQKCQTLQPFFKISRFVSVANCDDLTNALNAQPISVAVDATNWSPYKSGIFNNCKTSLNHGVLLVGASSSFWRVKNSWGAVWGESGYIRLAKGNTCGICNVASYPVK